MPGSILTPRSGELRGALRLGSRELGREVIQVLGFVSKWPPTAGTSPSLQGTPPCGRAWPPTQAGPGPSMEVNPQNTGCGKSVNSRCTGIYTWEQRTGPALNPLTSLATL